MSLCHFENIIYYITLFSKHTPRFSCLDYKATAISWIIGNSAALLCPSVHLNFVAVIKIISVLLQFVIFWVKLPITELLFMLAHALGKNLYQNHFYVVFTNPTMVALIYKTVLPKLDFVIAEKLQCTSNRHVT